MERRYPQDSPDWRPPKSQCYANALKKWLNLIIHEPQVVLKGSTLFLLCALPMVTYGPARLASVYYMGRRGDGFGVTWKEAAAFGFGTTWKEAAAFGLGKGASAAGTKGWVMGFSDCAAALMAGGSAYAILEMEVPLLVRFIYCFVFLLDIIYLTSGIFRYPALALEPNAKAGMLMLRGFLITFGSPIWGFMFFCVQLLWLLVCLLTGVGLLMLYPAGAALLSHYAYTEMIKHFIPPMNTDA